MKKLLLVFLGMLTLCSCNTVVNRQVQVGGGATPQQPFQIDQKDGHAPTFLNTVRILDDSLMEINKSGKHTTRKIYIERSGIRPTETNTKEVWATIRNETDYPLQIEGRVTWFDQYQYPLEGPSSWKRVFLPPNTAAAYKEFSTRVDVRFYMIDLREAR